VSNLPKPAAPARPHGPYQTERQAAAASLWASHGRDIGLPMDKANVAELAAALSGVHLGEWDRRIIEWLSGYEPSTVAVVCGLITRARLSAGCPREQLRTMLSALDTAAETKRAAVDMCGDCDARPDGALCGTCEYRLAIADDYDQLAEQLREAIR
jgi:hypothetical protein